MSVKVYGVHDDNERLRGQKFNDGREKPVLKNETFDF